MGGAHLSTRKPLTPEQRERKRAYDRERDAERSHSRRAPCGACGTTGCHGFRGDLTDTYDRADCRACGGSGTLEGTNR